MVRRRARPVTHAIPILACASVVGALPIAAGAQSPASPQARLQGVVVDERDYQPVQSATVAVMGLDAEVVTGRWGDFAFPDVAPGSVRLRVSAPGHPSVLQDVDVGATGVTFVQVVLPSVAAVLEELLVQGTPEPDNLEATARTAADLLALRVPRARIKSNSVGATDYQIRLREASTISGNVEPLILVDGVAVAREAVLDVLVNIPATDVEDIEILKGPAAAALYPYAANGVINVRTKRGGGGL